MSAILIRGGRVVDPANSLDAQRDLLIADGQVREIAAPGKLETAAKKLHAEIFDAAGLVVAPGLIDIHVHLREPGQTWKETIATGTAAAIAGGFTTVCAMPNTVPVNDTPEWTKWMQAPQRHAFAEVFPIAAATMNSDGEKLTDFAALKRAGAVGVSDDGKPILGDAMMRAVLEAAAKHDLVVIQHAEDTRLTGGCSMNAGALAFRMGLRGMPVEAESGIVQRDIELVRELTRKRGGPRLHVAHISTKVALDHVRAAKKDGLRVTCEVAPHHFILTEEAVAGHDTNARMNPPLRSAADRDAMLEGLLDGTVDCIATDHAPHATHEKEQEFDRAPNGIIGLETALGLTIGILHQQYRLPLSRALALLTRRPAAVVGLEAARGHLGKSAVANVTVFDPEAQWEYHAGQGRSRSSNTPFDGWKLPARVHATIVGGEVRYAPSAH